MLFDAESGELLALVDADWITAMRTGAVAASAIKSLRVSTARCYAFIGLGSTARATLRCLLAICRNEMLDIRLLRYKEQAERFAEEFGWEAGVRFTIVDTAEELVSGADVVVSCITDAQGLIVEDERLFKAGVLVVPVHTRGFQNCDTTFDKVYADDADHIRSFKYFDRFREFHQFEEVLKGATPGRESDTERILSYNIGLGLHDVLYASRIYDML